MRKCLYQLFILMLLALNSAVLQAEPSSKTYTLGIFAYRPKPIMVERYQPLVNYLNTQLSCCEIKLQILDLDEIESALANNQLDFIFTNPRHYIVLRHQNKLTGAIATLIKHSDSGASTQRLGGVIFTKNTNDDINQFVDIKGRRIAIPGTKYLGGYQAQAYELLKAGIELPNDANLIEFGSHDRVVDAVLSGKADVGFVRTEIIESLRKNGNLNLDDIKVINHQDIAGFPFITSTRLYPEWPFIALSNIPHTVINNVAAALLILDDTQSDLHEADIAGFASPADYLSVEEVARSLRLPPYERAPEFTLQDIWKRHKEGVILLALFLISTSTLLLLLFRRNRIIIKQQQLVRKQASHIQHIIDATQVGTWEWNIQTGETIFNERWAEIIGYTLTELSPVSIQTWKDLTRPDDLIATEKRLQLHFNGDTNYYDADFRMKHKSGNWVWINDRGQVTKWDENGSPLWMSGTHTDISERMFAQEQMRLASTVFFNSQEGILIADKDNRIVDVNPACLELTGYTRDEVIGNTPSLFSAGTQSAEFYTEMWETLSEFGSWQGEIWNRKKSGEIYSERLSIDKVFDDSGELQHYVAVFYDITHLKEHQAELEYIAYKDPLTGLPNRLLLRDRLLQAISKSKRNKKILAVCYLDLDGFKTVNDTYGHKAGDSVLVEVAKRLHDAVRADDTVARIGGDEFVLLMLDIDNVSELELVLERILETISNPYTLTKNTITDEVRCISTSIGLTLYPQDENDAGILLRHADQAMYISKKKGKNCYSFFDSNEEQRITSEHRLQQNVKLALERDEFRLFYQPKVNMQSGEIVGAEGLIRWQHPEKGILAPGVFLPSIERTRLIIDVGNWVLRQALMQLRAWLAEGIKLKVSINIDAMQLQQDDFVSSLKELLNEFDDVPASYLELEILESSALHDIEHVGNVMRECTQLGLQFSLDDFGTGYSSLTYLKRLPAHVLKIDQSFVRGLIDDPDDLVIIEGVLGLAHAFHRIPIAEGVETVQIGTILLNLGCKLAQGYAIARPMPAEDIPGWLSTFQIPKEWLESKNGLNFDSNDAITMMYIIHHRNILEIRRIIDKKDPSLIPKNILDHRSCDIGKWLDGDGKKIYGKFPEFNLIVDKHEIIHEVINKAMLLLGAGEHESLEIISIVLNKLSSEILNDLSKLRNLAGG